MSLEPPYEMAIDAEHPALVLVLVDQSDSMERESGHDSSIKKAVGVADAVNTLLADLIARCTMGNSIQDLFFICVIGYGRTVGPRIFDGVPEHCIISASALAKQIVRRETRKRRLADGSTEEYEAPIWMEPYADGFTPMCETFRYAKDVVALSLSHFSNCFPPVVVNITDGESSDGDPTIAAEALKRCSSTNGNVLLFNVHVSSTIDSTVAFPASDADLPDRFSKLMFLISSEVPAVMVRNAKESNQYQLSSGATGFVFNGGMSDVASVLAIATSGNRA